MKTKKKSLWRRLRHYVRRRKWIIPTFVLAAGVLIAGVILLTADIENRDALQVTADSNRNTGSLYRDVTWNGSRYRYNNLVTAILFAGLDSEGDMEEIPTYTMAPRADSIQLIILDQRSHSMKVLGLNRDTMTRMQAFALDGRERGMVEDHLARAYTYGNGGSVSCENLCDAVSRMLFGVPVRDYVVVNVTSLLELAQIIGPVELVVPNDDLTELDSRFAKGSTVAIDSSNLEFYVRTRDTETEQSNIGRMERQKSYITAAMDQIMSRLKNDSQAVWDDLEKIEQCIQTNITRSRYLDLVGILDNVSYSEGYYITPPGELKQGILYDEFYPDREALLEIVMDLFYLKQ